MSAIAVVVMEAEVTDAELATVQAAVDQASAALAELAAGQATVVLSTAAHLAELNAAYRGQAGPTDVLSFPAGSAAAVPGATPYLGDVIIAVEVATANAAAAGHPAAEELALLAVHGLLHLLGYEDESDEGAREMLRQELALGVRRADDLPEGLEP